MSTRRSLEDDRNDAARSIAQLLAVAEQDLVPASVAARLEAELLLSMSTGSNRATLLAFPERAVSVESAALFRSAIERRARGEPLAYITGEKEFYALQLHVSSAVLVPRADTELLVDTALQYLDVDANASVLDLGTGSGAIALALKQQRPTARLTAIDCDAAALAIARDNGRRLGLDVRFVESHWFEQLDGVRFDLIVGNPPYVPSHDPNFAGPLKFEPRVALDGGSDGLDAYRAILTAAPRHLAASGLLLLEHGFDQRATLLELAVAYRFEVQQVCEDLAGIPRVAVFRATQA
jgi:release factor glutamine methyltransferase